MKGRAPGIEGSEMWDSWYERDTGMGDFEERDSGNNHLNKLRTGMSVDENLIVKKLIFSVRVKYQANWRRSGCSAADTLQLLRGNENCIRSEVANLPKILNGP